MKKLLVVIDRIEEGIAVMEFEDRSLMELPARFLPPGAREGMAVKVNLELDPDSTNRFRQETEELQRQLRDRSKKKKD